MSNQNYFPSFQVFINSGYTKNPNRLVLPRAYSAYASVVSATFPVSWYNVPTGANTLKLSYRISGEGADRTFTFTVPEGQYTATELASVLTWSGTMAGSAGVSSIGCIYLPNQNKFQLLWRPISQITSVSVLVNAFASAIGFTSTTAFTSSVSTGSPFTDTSYKNALIAKSNTCADLSSVRNIRVQTNMMVRQFAGGTTTLAVIPVNQPFGSIVQWDGGFAGKLYDNLIQDIYVSLADDQDNQINFNGLPWSIVLQFDFKSPDVTPIYQDAVDRALVSVDENNMAPV